MSSHILVDYSPLTTLEVTQSRKMSPFKDEETRNQRYKSSLKITQPGRGKNKTWVSRHHSRPVYIVFIYRPGDSLNQWGILNGCQSAEDIVLRYYHLSRLLTYTTEAPAQSLVTLERRGQSRVTASLALTSQLSVRLNICQRVRGKIHNFIKVLSRDSRGCISKGYIGATPKVRPQRWIIREGPHFEKDIGEDEGHSALYLNCEQPCWGKFQS